MNPVQKIVSILVIVLCISASSNSGKINYSDDGRLRVSCINVPIGIEPESIELKLFLNREQVLDENNFQEKRTGVFVATEDSYWPAGFYDAQLSGLLKCDIIVEKVEMKSGVFTFLTFDYNLFSQIVAHSTNENPVVLSWEKIAHNIERSESTLKEN